MNRSYTWCTLILVCLIASTCFTQNGNPKPIAVQLAQHHIDLSKHSLVDALKNSNAEVRYLAAQQLAEDKAQDAIPAIEDALARETVPGTSINIAFALGLLGDDKGVTSLSKACRNPHIPVDLRVRAIHCLLFLNSKDHCAQSIVDMLQPATDPQLSRLPALSLVGEFDELSKSEHAELLRLVFDALSDNTPALRIEAASALARLKDASAIPALESAIAGEQDPEVRSQMQFSLQQLRRSTRKPASD